MNTKYPLNVQRKAIYQSGFSLIEIMVALTIGLFLMAGIIQIFLGSKIIYRTTESSSRIQENGRLAIELLNRDLRMAGYKGCLRSSLPTLNVLNNSTSFNWSFGQEIQGFEASGTTWSPALDAAISGLQILPGTDVITVRTIDSEDIYVTGQPSNSGDCKGASFSSSANLKVTNNNLLKDEDIVLVTNCERAVVFQITNFNAKENIVHGTGGSAVPGNSTKDLGGCLVDGEMMKISTKTYFIRTGSSGQPALWRRVASNDPEELIEGVQNMQIMYGVDDNNDREADQYTTADTVNSTNRCGSPAATNWCNVVSTRISLLLQSVDDQITTKAQIYDYNNAIQTASDGRLRQVFTVLIGVRSRLP